ncbi:MAG: hypothetical protein PF501_07460 [Salinisphaera sp.]|nr:hypothetical protein [Salinisphaera sp.]
MKHTHFYIGLGFMVSGSFGLRCTDMGTRTTLAIQIDRDDSIWH